MREIDIENKIVDMSKSYEEVNIETDIDGNIINFDMLSEDVKEWIMHG